MDTARQPATKIHIAVQELHWTENNVKWDKGVIDLTMHFMTFNSTIAITLENRSDIQQQKFCFLK